MTRRQFLTSSAIAGAVSLTGCQGVGATSNRNALVGDRSASNPKPVYELRVYTITPGKEEEAHRLFRLYASRFFERYSIHEEGYWMPTDPSDKRLFVLLRYDNEASKVRNWTDFKNDPVWQNVHEAMSADGAVADNIESHLLSRTDYSRWQRSKRTVSQGGVFELRTYTTPAGKLPHLDARFRDHTCRLFEKHGMKNWLYFHHLAGQPEAGNTLTYFLIHESEAAAAWSFDWFRQDDEWLRVRARSERLAGGPLTVPDGVQSIFLRPLPHSVVQ